VVVLEAPVGDDHAGARAVDGAAAGDLDGDVVGGRGPGAVLDGEALAGDRGGRGQCDGARGRDRGVLDGAVRGQRGVVQGDRGAAEGLALRQVDVVLCLAQREQVDAVGRVL